MSYLIKGKNRIGIGFHNQWKYFFSDNPWHYISFIKFEFNFDNDIGIIEFYTGLLGFELDIRLVYNMDKFKG